MPRANQRFQNEMLGGVYEGLGIARDQGFLRPSVARWGFAPTVRDSPASAIRLISDHRPSPSSGSQKPRRREKEIECNVGCEKNDKEGVLTAKIQKSVVLRRRPLQEEGIKLPDRLHLFGGQKHLEAKNPDRDPVPLVVIREKLCPHSGCASVACDEHATGAS